MTHTYEELRKKTVAQLREIAAGMDHESLRGYTQIHKAELLSRLFAALGIETHEHHDVTGVDKASIKARIRKLKGQREAILASKDKKRLKDLRRGIHSLKRALRRFTV